MIGDILLFHVSVRGIMCPRRDWRDGCLLPWCCREIWLDVRFFQDSSRTYACIQRLSLSRAIGIIYIYPSIFFTELAAARELHIALL